MNNKSNDNNDDGSALVNEVIEENPPRERGERNEWNEHVGWHRKEVVRKNTLKLRGSVQKRRQQQNLNSTISIKDKHPLDHSKAELSFSFQDFYNLATYLVFGTIFLRMIMIFLCKRQEIGNGRKSR